MNTQKTHNSIKEKIEGIEIDIMRTPEEDMMYLLKEDMVYLLKIARSATVWRDYLKNKLEPGRSGSPKITIVDCILNGELPSAVANKKGESR